MALRDAPLEPDDDAPAPQVDEEPLDRNIINEQDLICPFAWQPGLMCHQRRVLFQFLFLFDLRANMTVG
jgi:hypothetical protein